MSKIVWISESHIGEHLELAQEFAKNSNRYKDMIFYSFTYLPNFKKLDEEIKTLDEVEIPSLSNFWINGRLKSPSYSKVKIDTLNELMSNIDKGDLVVLAQDGDFGGTLMASLLYYKLKEAGVSKIIRMPLIDTENGFLGVSKDFVFTKEELLRILNFLREEQYYINSLKGKYGFRKTLALLSLLEEKEHIVKNENPQGISIETYLSNWLKENEE